MNTYLILKHLHMTCALLSIAGFVLRGALYLRREPASRGKLLRIAPHVIDTVLLASAIGLLMVLNLSPLGTPWVMAKILALLAYIGLGLVAFRFGKTLGVQRLAFGLALLTAVYLLAVARLKTPLPGVM